MKRFYICAAVALGGAFVSGILSPLVALEVPKEASATTFLGALTEGENYHITSGVRSDGFMRVFIVDTSYGQYQVIGIDLTKAFIQELKALSALEKMSTSDEFSKSFGQAAVAPIQYGADLIINPVDTIGRSLSGVANMFDRANAAMENQKDVRESTTDSLLGVDDARRNLAVELGVDPYTQFAPLAQKLTEIADAAAAGGLTVKAALAVIPGGVGIAVSSAGSAEGVKNTLRDKTSAQIVKEVKATLLRLNVPAESVARLTENRSYTPADLLVMSKALARLNAANTEIFVDRAASATTRDDAFFQRRRAELLSERSNELGVIISFVSVGDFPLNQTQNGNIVAAFPLDLFAWTANADRSAKTVTANLRRTQTLAQKPIFATTNTVTPMATSEMEKLGWQVVRLR